MQNDILLPPVALVALTAVVWVRLYFERVGEMRARKIRPQELATSATGAGVLRNVRAADNFRNLFEVPVLFYALCGFLAATGLASGPFVVAAWLFVALRCVHSFIHITYNRVTHRFTVYVASTALLFLMWAAFAVELLRSAD